MKKTVQIVTIPLDKKDNAPFFKKDDLVLRKVLGGPNLQAMLKFKIIDKNQIASARLQQLLVLSDDNTKDVLCLWDDNVIDICLENNENVEYGNPKKIIASYPQLEGTLPISKETVQAWIDNGTPGEGSVEIDDLMYLDCNVWRKNRNHNKPKLDPQGNLLLEFGNKSAEEKPSIPTDEEIKERILEFKRREKSFATPDQMFFGAYGYEQGYKQALKDLGYE